MEKIIFLERSTLKLMRIPFSFFLMPVYFLALSQCANFDLFNAIVSFIVLHLFIYPASNGYNSFIDKDTTPIGGLENPPQPTLNLFYTSLAFDIVGLLIAFSLSAKFFLCVLIYILASRAYSSRMIRLKKYPIISLLTVMIFQGGFTFYMVLDVVSATSIFISNELLFIVFGCNFLIAGIYPLTQVYQHKADKDNGDTTISLLLGLKGTFYFSAFMFLIANLFFYNYFSSINSLNQFFILQFFLMPTIFFFVQWMLKVHANEQEASFKNMMRMNLISSISMNCCFILLTFMNQLK
jgi:1,4-dihydroxy-2-naphthoate polyprenyltransferase